MNYISRVEIDDKNRLKMKELIGLSGYHNWVERSFPIEYDENNRPRHLWRVDTIGKHKYLLLISDSRPDLDKLEKFGVKGTASTKKYDQYLDKISNDSYWKFRLVANPTHRIFESGKSRVVPHVTIEQQMTWLLDRSEKNGFQFLKLNSDIDSDSSWIRADGKEVPKSLGLEYSFKITQRDWPNLIKDKDQKKAGIKVRLSRVTFEGILKVTDSQKFKDVLVKGLGREKAYGMGLLTVLPYKK